VPTKTDYKKLTKELAWLKKHPHFDERPASIKEFLGDEYLGIESRVRKSLLGVLEELFGEETDGERIAKVSKAIFTGAIGIGKTTLASIVLPYMAHWVLCLKDPQGFFKLLPGSRIAFMQMSTSEGQAKEVVFGDIKARIEHSKWFSEKYPFDRAFKNQIRFPKDIWILPGDSAETTFEGYNILGGILDEADSHKTTDKKDYAEQGFDTIHARIASRFEDLGFILVIGQMKKSNGFAAKKYQEFRKDPQAAAFCMTIWESFGWEHYSKPDGTRDSFWYDAQRREVVPSGIASAMKTENLIEIPTVFKADFSNNPEKALRDLAGIPPIVGSSFISLTYKIVAARDRWIERHGGYETPVRPDGRWERWFVATHHLKRVLHVDLGFSPEGDALGMAMGHVPEVVEIDGERKPFIVIDFLLRIHAPAGREIFLGDVRRIIYDLRDERKFKIVKVTMDGFQSTDTRQQLERKRIQTELVSVDKNMLPYEDLREALYEDRIAIPKYMTLMRPNDSQLTEVALKELSELIQDEKKVDHPVDGSKDVADAMAGVVYTLMGDRAYHRKVTRLDSVRIEKEERQVSGNPLSRYGGVAQLGMNAPLPPFPDPSQWRPPSR
jgi:hypothetical protein